MSAAALLAALPALRGRVPFVSLGQFPTPVERVTGLLPPSVELWVKRDDKSGEVYGGNKVRKLELLLAGAKERIVTLGAIGSHHVLATAIYGRQLGHAVDAVVFPQPPTEHVRQQLLADVAAGARLHPTRGYLGILPKVARLRRGATFVAPGGSSPLGTLGYVGAAYELSLQIRAGLLPRPDVIYVALGSGGTVAGLWLGLQHELEIVAVRVVDRLVANRGAVRRLAERTAALLRAHGIALSPRARLRVEHAQFGGGYGRATPAAEISLARAADSGLGLEPTYTAKVMAALCADAERLAGKRVLFWNTYSSVDLTPLLVVGPGDAALPAALRRLFSVGGAGAAGLG